MLWGCDLVDGNGRRGNERVLLVENDKHGDIAVDGKAGVLQDLQQVFSRVRVGVDGAEKVAKAPHVDIGQLSAAVANRPRPKRCIANARVLRVLLQFENGRGGSFLDPVRGDFGVVVAAAFLLFCGLGWLGLLGEAGGDGAQRGGGEGVEGEEQSGFHGFFSFLGFS